MIFIMLIVFSLLIFWPVVRDLFSYPIWSDKAYDKYLYTIVVPVFSIAILFLRKDQIFQRVEYSFLAGIPLLLIAMLLRLIVAKASNLIGAENALSMQLFGLVTLWIAGFIVCYGINSFLRGAFPILLLLLAVPLPDSLWHQLTLTVQHGSAEVAFLIFNLFRVPVLRNGLVFSLPDITIRIEEACSGIHSTMAILLLSLIASYLFFTSAWRRAALVVLAVPIVCITNGMRIAALTLLAAYVDRNYMYGSLHIKGGLGFFLLALSLLYATLQLLKTRTPRSAALDAQGSSDPA